jgi:hypothetical protein
MFQNPRQIVTMQDAPNQSLVGVELGIELGHALSHLNNLTLRSRPDNPSP